METKIIVISKHADYVALGVMSMLHSLDTELEVLLCTLDTLEKNLQSKWDYAIILNHCIKVSSPLFIGKVMHRIEMEFHIPKNDKECVAIDKVIRKRILEFYMVDIQGRETLGADSCGAFCDSDK